MSAPHDNAIEMKTSAAPDTANLLESAPLIVDFDTALVRANIILEALVTFVKPNPARLFLVIGWLLTSPRQFVHRLAQHVDLDTHHVPVDDSVVGLANAAGAAGRPVYLLTSLPPALVTPLKDRFDFVTDVLPRRGSLTPEPTAHCPLSRRFENGYEYIGGQGQSIGRWPIDPRSQSIAVCDRPTEPITSRTAKPKQIALALLKSARPHQWFKNLLVFVPIVLGGMLDEPFTVLAGVVAFVAISAVASATYIVNDALDVGADRRHWSKRHRPIASGGVGVGTALVAALILMGVGVGLGASLDAGTFAVLAVYIAVTLAYSFVAKRLQFVDCAVLGLLFTLRLALGVAAADVLPSSWLFTFSLAFFTSLALSKRYTEIIRAGEHGLARIEGRGYATGDGKTVLTLGWLTAFLAIAVIVLYIVEDAFQLTFYGQTQWLWGFPPLIFLFVARIWGVSMRGKMHDDPLNFAIVDWPCRVILGLLVLCFALAWLG